VCVIDRNVLTKEKEKVEEYIVQQVWGTTIKIRLLLLTPEKVGQKARKINGDNEQV